jgi:hypothetical protein
VKKRKLASKVKGEGKTPAHPQLPAVPRYGSRAGVEIDGAIYPLEGEPPTATTKGWGKIPGQS